MVGPVDVAALVRRVLQRPNTVLPNASVLPIKVRADDTDGSVLTTVGGVTAWADPGSLVVSAPDALDTYGTATTVASGATATVVSVVAGASGFKVWGMSCTGNGDAEFKVTIAGAPILSCRINTNNRSVYMPLPEGIAVAAGVTVLLTVTNESLLSCDYEATLLGE